MLPFATVAHFKHYIVTWLFKDFGLASCSQIKMLTVYTVVSVALQIKWLPVQTISSSRIQILTCVMCLVNSTFNSIIQHGNTATILTLLAPTNKRCTIPYTPIYPLKENLAKAGEWISSHPVQQKENTGNFNHELPYCASIRLVFYWTSTLLQRLSL